MSIFQFSIHQLDGKPFDWDSVKGKKILIVNTASKCGFTPQYADLQKIYLQYKDNNFTILGVPSNDFAQQEPGKNSEIAEFCSLNYGVTFPMLEKISVKGENQHPLYAFLTQAAGDEVDWNFHKYMINEAGEVIKGLSAKTLPFDDEIINWLKK